MRNRLLPCPMCSETQIKLIEWPADATICEILCLNCKLNTGAKFTKNEAIKHWNNRTDTGKDKLVAALKFYANAENMTEIMDDFGKIAEAALKEAREDDAI